MMNASTVIKFWFEEIRPEQWWQVDATFDRLVEQRFELLLKQAMVGELYTWRATSEGRLAEIIVLDQFSRNIYRGKAAAFAQDPVALVLTQEAMLQQIHLELPLPQRSFLLMPYMHSESLYIHRHAESLYQQYTAPSTYDFALRHKAIIERFHRYPHRNAILGRASTPEELLFLEQPGSSF